MKNKVRVSGKSSKDVGSKDEYSSVVISTVEHESEDRLERSLMTK